MKILMVTQYFYPEQFQVNDLCFELAKQGHDVTVLTGLPNYPSGVVDEKYRHRKNREEVIQNVKVLRTSLIGRGTTTKRLALNYLSFMVSSSWKALRIEKDFDIILSYQLSPITQVLPAIIMKKRSKKKLVIYCFDLWPESLVSGGVGNDSILYRIMFKFSKWIYKKADTIWTSSKMFENYFNEKFSIHDKEILHLPVYAESMFDDIHRVENKPTECNLVFAGNIGEMQSVETILLAANELKADAMSQNATEKEIKFHIVGDGSSALKCRELADRLQLPNVVFHGKHPIADMPKFYGMADAFLVTMKDNPTISYTLPNKVQSYLAAGKPIIAAINGETANVIAEASCGLCAPAEDYKALAAMIQKFVNEPKLVEHYSENSRNYYEEHFSKERYYKQLNVFLQKYTS